MNGTANCSKPPTWSTIRMQAFEKPIVPKPDQRWCRGFSRRYCWGLLSASTDQASLPFHHPDMQLYKHLYQKMIQQGVHPHLVLNFDQVWRCAFNWTGKMRWKKRANVGKRSKKVKAPQTLDKKRHAVRGLTRASPWLFIGFQWVL